MTTINHRILLGSLLASGLMACTTVEMSPRENSIAVSNPLEIKDRFALKKSARSLTSVFTKEGWARIGQEGQQSAMSMLIWGKSKAQSVTDPVKAYLEKRSLQRDVIDDVNRARLIVVETSERAEAFLNKNPDVSDVKSELDSLEKALLCARQAETTFLAALKQTGLDASHEDYRSYVESVDRLRSAADAFGMRVRGSEAPVNAS